MRKCRRCNGTGQSPTEAWRYCKNCCGFGKWGKEFILREDGRIERVCKHGVGHTVAIHLVSHKYDPEQWAWLHGCDGCCASWEKKR